MNNKIWHGSWSDGNTAASHPVEIRLQQDGLHFHLTETETSEQHFWAYSELNSPNPINKETEHVLLTSESHVGERLFVNDKSFANEVLNHAPKITRRAHQWSMLKWPLGIAVAILGFWLLTYFNVISPAKRIAFLIPDNVRTNIGVGVVNLIRKNAPLCTSEQGDAALAKIVARLNAATPKNQKFNIRVADIKITNAFAAPGDQIIVSAKLIEEADNADEVTGVIAHEMGHSIERHPEASIVRALGLLSIMQLMTAGEAGAVSEIAFFMMQSGYSRTAEQQADEHAARILKLSNINSKPLAGFFERIIAKYELKKLESQKKETAEKKAPDNEDNKTEKSALEETGKTLFDFLNTHPPTKQRIEFFSQSNIKTSPPILNETEWQALRNICGTKQKTNPDSSNKGNSGKGGNSNTEDSDKQGSKGDSAPQDQI